jgi:hypothetical protein
MSGATAAMGSPEREKLHAYLKKEKSDIDKIRIETNSDLDESWFLNDAQGFQRWRDPPSPASQDENYSWRDYFHGKGADHPEWKGRTDILPVDRPYISAPFRSTTTGQFKIALSAPVHDAEGKVVGVLCRTIQLGKLLGSYKKLIGEDRRDQNGERVIALLDLRTEDGRLLDHPWMTPENLQKLRDDEVFNSLTIYPAEQRELEKLRELVRTDQPVNEENIDRKYFDPIHKIDAEANAKYGMPWLAAFWPVGDTGWFAVVQERRDDALRPVREIQDGLIKYALMGTGLCLTFVATSWYFVRRVVRTQSGSPGSFAGKKQANGSVPGSLTGSV